MNALSRTTVLVLLAATACLQQGRYLARAVLPAQDVVDTVSVAQRIERDGLTTTIRSEAVPPLFPALIAVAHRTASAVGIIEARDWARPPQWVAAAALVLAVFPIFLLSERAAGSTAAAVLATVAFIALPSLSRLGGDGLGDAVHLCLVAWGVWLFVAARHVAAGLCIAAALLVRLEAAVVPLAVAATAVRYPTFRAPRFFAAASLCVVPYLACGITSPTGIAERLRGGAAPTELVPLNANATPDGGAADDGRSFGRKDSAHSTRFHGFAATVGEYATEATQAFGFLLLPLALIGLVRQRNTWTDRDTWLLLASGIVLVMLFVAAYRGGYLATRHFALAVLLMLPYAAIGLAVVERRLGDRRGGALMTAGFVVASLVVTARPLHDSLRPHRDAAAWLDADERRAGAVLDQQALTALFTGRTTYRFDASAEALRDPQLAYVVIERRDLEADTPRGAAIRAVLGDAESAAAAFTADRDRRERDVLIFSRPAPQLASRELYDAR